MTISECTFRAYPTQIIPAEMDQAIRWNGKIKIKTKEEIFVFYAITKDNDGNYFGHRKRKGEQQSVALNLESIVEIRLEDKIKSEGRTRLIYRSIGFVATLYILIVAWSIGGMMEEDCTKMIPVTFIWLLRMKRR